jgi:diguanylate cyclase (GGDEF)-like protein
MRASVGRGDADCIAIIDIDHFKQVNDRHGHTVGDEALRVFAKTALQSVRVSDCLARIGGEEFAILMRGTTVDQAERICERLGQRIAETGIAAPGGEFRLTISTGIAALDGNADAAFLAADSALYRAKNAGRSRLEVAA